MNFCPVSNCDVWGNEVRASQLWTIGPYTHHPQLMEGISRPALLYMMVYNGFGWSSGKSEPFWAQKPLTYKSFFSGLGRPLPPIPCVSYSYLRLPLPSSANSPFTSLFVFRARGGQSYG
ncbi:hypothetical protein B0H12DRAFT_115770 [Mycena haematopus]|nr:hypothetical protein B0H12DRAFT_115770 [Mycena haematopus]